MDWLTKGENLALVVKAQEKNVKEEKVRPGKIKCACTWDTKYEGCIKRGLCVIQEHEIEIKKLKDKINELENEKERLHEELMEYRT